MRHHTEPTPPADSDPQHVVTTGASGATEFVIATDAYGQSTRLVTPALLDGQTPPTNPGNPG